MHQPMGTAMLDHVPATPPQSGPASPAPASAQQDLTVNVSAECHSAFFAGTPKIVVAACDATRWQTVERPAGLAFFRFELNDQGNGRIESFDSAAGGPDVSLTVPPAQCLGLLALSTEGKRQLDALAAWWSARMPGEIPDPIICSAETDADHALARFLADRLLREAASASRSIVGLRRDLAELREEHDAAQTVLTVLSLAVSRLQIPPLNCTLVLHPGGSTLGPDSEASGLRQRLPICSQGLAAVALHVAKGAAACPGRLLVSLKALESGVKLVTWSVPYDQLTSGWNFLEIPSVITGPKQTVEMVVRWDGASAGAPHISLSQQTVGDGIQLATERGRRVRYAMAMQLWTGVPGTRMSASAFARDGEAVPGPGEGRDLFVPTFRMAQAKLLQPQNLDLGFNILSTDSPGMIQLHPLAGTPLSHAVIPSACPPGMRRLIASVRTANPEGPLVEYAMMLTPLGVAPAFPADPLQPLPPGVIVSPWVSMPADTKGNVIIALDRPNDRPCDLHIATRVPPGSGDNFAWARWFGFHIQLA